MKFDIDIQRQTIALGLEDFSPNAMLPNVCGGQYGRSPEDWREDVVAFVYYMLKAGLIAPIAGIEGYQNKDANELRKILQEGDAENGFDVDLVWDIIHFFGTPGLTRLLQECELYGWDALDSELSPSLQAALAQHGILAPKA
ncbi:hypothetical protein [Pseudoduganella chitinolytica]|uniref:Uncharacterized protein n=1 Tax=Pseudoduganella chitinolytica TaxID=34070 RepID=A0ABY8BEC0_9BURK|nr:hypothetical protein [Pseudoduganella chitinolytica]WEF34259.1 hypothetical protein PX653_05670 [Pseudoduganella chitinolytica]